MWVDSHAHLDFPDLQVNLREVLNRAAQAGVDRIQTIGCIAPKHSDLETVVRMTSEHDPVYAALGVHPHNANDFDDSVGQAIQAAMMEPKVLAWGEIGLDYHYDFSPRETQQHAFRSQIRLAQEAARPIIIHTRDADADTLEIVRQEYSDYAGPRGVFHCFSSTWETAEAALKLGFYLGFGGMLTFKKTESVRDVASRAPLDRLLIETDAPYLAPVPFRGKTNEPSHVALVGKKLAELRGLEPAEMAALTTGNFETLFRP